ncbi:Coiled-coil domain-containing protein 147 [Fukomys damarensis]|uniref:Coiled-coil domain-containing protein 147 n=1 Tax=Fukomys damarensis TaxID=885580 RepID=A0A091EAR3_FUKDA|nr:Coiled-coil domain-containing protein 147 [Fukomys damarensis]
MKTTGNSPYTAQCDKKHGSTGKMFRDLYLEKLDGFLFIIVGALYRVYPYSGIKEGFHIGDLDSAWCLLLPSSLIGSLTEPCRCCLEKEKLYVELKHILARQPGPEAAEQLQIYRYTLREKTKQLKVLSSELNMYESQSQEYKYEIEKLGNELMNVKKKYLAQKRKELIQKNKDKLPIDDTFLIVKPPGPHFIGGGFPLSKTTKVKS